MSLFIFCSGSDNIGKTAFPAMQCAPCFSSTFPRIFGGKEMRALVPCGIYMYHTLKSHHLTGIDQDPYFRMTRDVAPRLHFKKPAVMHSRFLPPLLNDGKMSASIPTNAIFLNDEEKEIKKKINRALSGGRQTRKEQMELGANLEFDIPFQYLSFFLEDDKELEGIREKYGSGKLMSGTVKKRCVQVLGDVISRINERKALITEETIQQFMKYRLLSFE